MQKLPSGKSNSVYFPDGTLAPRPNDGYSFVDFKGSRYTWDDYAEKWYSNTHTSAYTDIATSIIKKNASDIANLAGIPPEQLETGDKQAISVDKKCECGADFVGTPNHGPWCPKAGL